MVDATEMDLQQNAEINELWKKVHSMQTQVDDLIDRVSGLEHRTSELHEQVEPLETIKHRLEKLHELMSKLK